MLESCKLIGGKDLKAVLWYNLKPEVQLETMPLLQHIRIMFRPFCSEGEPLNREEKGEMSLTYVGGWMEGYSIYSIFGRRML